VKQYSTNIQLGKIIFKDEFCIYIFLEQEKLEQKYLEKRFGGMGRKYTSRLGDLSTKRNTTAKQSIQ
jgi:hypothetical protein